MAPEDVYSCFEAVLELPLSKQAVCVRLAAEGSALVWREWCRQRRVKDLSWELLEKFDQWLSGAAPDQELSQVAKQFGETLPQDLRDEEEPAGGYAGWSLLGIAMIALDQCGEVHHSILHTDVCYAAAAYCRIGIEAVGVSLDRLTCAESEFLEQWWRRCCDRFPELAGMKPAERLNGPESQ